MSNSANSKPTYSEFLDPRLAGIYDVMNPFGADEKFFCSMPEKLSASTIIDLGCGTGWIACKLAERGYHMIGVEPSRAMLEVARRRSNSSQVTWVEGDSVKLNGLHADLLMMTSHVSQFLLEEEEWLTTLKNIHNVLEPGGHLVFDSKNPLMAPWRRWTRALSSRKRDTPSNGPIEIWYELLGIQGNRVRYEIHYLFVDSCEELISVNELIYRSQDEITQALSETGFSIENIYGDWDSGAATSTSSELIFIAVKN